MVDWKHVKGRLGASGQYACVGDVVEVVKGRKYPIGMKMVVCGFSHYCKYEDPYNGFRAFADPQIMFGGEGRIERINADNVRIIALTEDRGNPEYNDVHEMEVYA